MNKTAIKNFAVWARNKLIADISYRAGLIGITEKGIASPLPQSTGTTEFYDIGSTEPYAINGDQVNQRRRLVELINQKANDSDYQNAYKYIIEEVAYTWFNRLIAIRFMEVNDYLPSHIRVLSSETGKLEPDLVTNPFDAELDFNSKEEMKIIQLKQDNKLDELFCMLFIKQCNALNGVLPALFEKTNDYMELLLNVSVVDQDGVVYHLIHDISEEDFDVERGGQVEIIGWLYQYYNTDPKDETFSLLKKNIKITKDRIPSATQLFTPDWIVRYMVENSLGRVWLEGHDDQLLEKSWKYYIKQENQESSVNTILEKVSFNIDLQPENIKVIDPCMGSGHVLVYAFDVMMQIYESVGYSQRDAAKSILQNNIFGLDIDNRAFQMAYFALLMKARKYNRRILNADTACNLMSISESNYINRKHMQYLGGSLQKKEKETAHRQITEILDLFYDAKEYGSIITVPDYDWSLLEEFVDNSSESSQMTLETYGLENTKYELRRLLRLARVMAQKYTVVVTNPPYMSSSGMDEKLSNYVKTYYVDGKSDMSTVMMIRCKDFCVNNGYMSMINIPVWMFISSYGNLRKKLLQEQTIINMLHLGRGVFGSDFGTTAFVLKKGVIENYKAVYRKLHIEVGNVDSLEQKEAWFFDGMGKYTTPQHWFEKIPTSPIAYWLSEKAVSLFSERPALGTVADPRQGLATGNDAKYLRSWSEINFEQIRFEMSSTEAFWNNGGYYAPFNKGGAFRKWYGNNNLVIRFSKECYAELLKSGNHLPSRQFYFRPGITWSSLTAGDFSGRYCDAGFVFAGKGPMCFPNNKEDIFYLLAFLNSKLTSFYMKVFSSTTDFNQGPMRDLPLILDKSEIREQIEAAAQECISLCKADWDSFETSWEYKKHPLVNGEDTIEAAFSKWNKETEKRFEKVKENEQLINKLLISLYGLNDEMTETVEDKNVSVRLSDINREIKSLLSYAVGCMFGRYSLDRDGLVYAGGNWDENNYQTFIPDEDAIIPITDEEYLEDDIISLLCEWLKKAFGANNLEENLDFIAKGLNYKAVSSREAIRRYFLNEFFADHCATYAYGTLGKKPIYWLFDSGKQNGFKALIYLHRYTEDTIGNVRIDYLHRIQRVYESEVNRMQDMIDHSTNAREVANASKRQEKLRKQIKECREYDEKISHLALSRIAINLDDGVRENYNKIQTANDKKKYQVLAKL